MILQPISAIAAQLEPTMIKKRKLVRKESAHKVQFTTLKITDAKLAQLEPSM